MATVAIVRTRNGVPESADQATLRVTSAGNTTIYGPVVILPTAVGTYSAQVNLGPGTYTAVWTFSVADYPDDVVSRLFTLDPPTVVTDGITLMQLERMIARRLGPYYRFPAAAGSSITRLAATRLKSSLALGSYEDTFLLRRGVTTQNLLIPLYDPADRVRIVAEYDPNNGYLLNDRAWTYGPDVGNVELVEVMYLDPDLELRPSVLDSLKRCFFWDTFTLALSQSGYNPSVDLTTIMPWVTQPSQIKAVGIAQGLSRGAPQLLDWWRVSRSGKTITLWTQGSISQSLTIVALRPVSSYVNEETSLTGPNDDLDMLYADPDYLAWAGIVELWKNVPERLTPLVHEGLRTDLKAAAAEFTKKSLMVAQQIPDTFQINFGSSNLAHQQIGNLPEPVV